MLLSQDAISQMACWSPSLQPPKYELSLCLRAQVESNLCLDTVHLVRNLCQSQTSEVRDEPEVGPRQEATKASPESTSSRGQSATFLEREVWD